LYPNDEAFDQQGIANAHRQPPKHLLQFLLRKLVQKLKSRNHRNIIPDTWKWYWNAFSDSFSAPSSDFSK
jgi:hypothetical protein